MEGWLVLLGLLALAWILVGPLLTFSLLSRVWRLETDLRQLKRSQEAAAISLARLGPLAAPRPSDKAPASTLTDNPPDTVEIWVDEPQETKAPGPTRPSGGLWDDPGPLAPPPVARPLATHPPDRKTSPVVEPATAEKFSLEELLAGKWLTWVGALAVIIGVGFFFKYTIDQKLIGPTGRVLLGILTGMLCFAGGAFAMLRTYQFLAQGLVGAALGILYLSLFAAFSWYGILSQPAAFAGMVIVTATALAFSARFDAQSTAVLGLLGGFLTPFMLSTGIDAQWTLFSYILLLDAGVLAIATFRKWQTLQGLAFAGTLLIWLAWFDQHYQPEKLSSTVILMTAFFLLFALLGIWHNVLRRQAAQPADFVLILGTPVVYFIGLYGVTEAEYSALHGTMAVALAASYLGFGLFSLARHPQGKSVVVALGGVAASFLTLAIPLQLTGHWIAIAWAAESLLLVELGLRFHEVKLRLAGFGLLGVLQIVLFFYAATTLYDPDHFDTRFRTYDALARDLGPNLPGSAVPAVAHIATAPQPWWIAVWNGRSFSFLASALVMGVLAWEYRRRFGTGRGPAPGTQAEPGELVPNAASQAGLWLVAAVPLTALVLLQVETYAVGYSQHWIGPTFWGLASVWTALAATGLVAFAIFRGPRHLDRVGFAVFGLLALLVLISLFGTLSDWRSDWARQTGPNGDVGLWRIPLFNPRGFGLLFAIGAAAGSAFLYRIGAGESGVSDDPPIGRLPPAAALGLFAHLTGLILLTVEVYAQGVIHDWRTATSLAITFVWTVYAVATLVAGIYYRSAMVRILSLALFLLTTGKVFLYDVWHLQTSIRTLAFVGLGISLLLVSYLYQRFRDRIRAWIAPIALVILLPAGLAIDLPAAFGGEVRADDATPPDLIRVLPERWPIGSESRAVDKEGTTKDRPASARERLVRIVLPAEIYRAARADLGDLRILSADNANPAAAYEIPYLLVRPLDGTRVVERSAPLLNLSLRRGATEFLLDLGETVEPVNELTIEVSDVNRNYERPVKVFGADRRDAAEWNLLTRDAYVMDVTRAGHRLKVGRVEFPPSRFHFYKIVVDNLGEPPLRIEGARLRDCEDRREPRHRFDATLVSQEHLAKEKRTRVVFDVGYDRLPTLGLHLDIAYAGDFYRPATLEMADSLSDPQPWRTVASGPLYRMDHPGMKATVWDIPYTETTGRYLRLTIENGDDLPLQIRKGTVLGIDKYLVADQRRIAVPGRTAALYAGSDALAAPNYDLARTLDLPSAAALPEFKLGSAEANPSFSKALRPALPWSEEHQALLWGVTLGGIAVLGGLTVLLLRKVALGNEEIPPPPLSPPST